MDSTQLRVTSDTTHSPHIEALYAGIDWIGLTLRRDASDWSVWVDRCREVVELIAQEGDKLEAWGMEGYRGLRAAGSFYGVRDDGAYCRLTGHSAHHHYDRVYRSDCNCSRIDLQVTVRLEEMDPGTGIRHEEESLRANELLPPSRRRKIWHISGNDGGYTLYIGSLHSERHGYIYNKEVQSAKAQYSRCWRYEVRNKNTFANDIALHFGTVRDNRPQDCAALVAEWFRARGLILPWHILSVPVVMPIERELPPEADRKLEWLKTQVRPALRWLNENGYQKAAMEALFGTGEYPSTPINMIKPIMGG
jgi:hypothetical protein